MKIVKQVRDLHGECRQRYERLLLETKEVLKPRVEEYGWFYLARLKELESFALKIETGRVPDPSKLEDFFACTIVVPTIAQIEYAERLIMSLYNSVERRPRTDSKTHKQSSSFAFDDLRIYVARRPSSSGRDPDLDGVVFEVQIKTILQHAWSISTHDLIYKTDTVSWPRERIAFQVKAMLEHAEVAIAEANRLADAPAVAKKDERTAGILRIIEDLSAIWPRERLPKDIKRLAETVFLLLRASDIRADDFSRIVAAERGRAGLLPADLSPYALTVQALANNSEFDFKDRFCRRHSKTRILIHDDMELPDWMRQKHPRIVNLGRQQIS